MPGSVVPLAMFALRSYRHRVVLPVILMSPNLKSMAPLWMKVSNRHLIGHFWNNKYKNNLFHLSSFKLGVLVSEMFFSVMFFRPSTTTFPYSISTKFPPTVSEKDA